MLELCLHLYAKAVMPSMGMETEKDSKKNVHLNASRQKVGSTPPFLTPFLTVDHPSSTQKVNLRVAFCLSKRGMYL